MRRRPTHRHFTRVCPALKNYSKSRGVGRALRWDASRETIRLFSIDQILVKEHLVKSSTAFHDTPKTSAAELRGAVAREKVKQQKWQDKRNLDFVRESIDFFSAGLPTSTLSVISLETRKRKKTAYMREKRTKRTSARWEKAQRERRKRDRQKDL